MVDLGKYTSPMDAMGSGWRVLFNENMISPESSMDDSVS